MGFFIGNPLNYSVNEFNIYREEFTATEGQTVFTLNSTYKMNKNRISVNVEGVPQYSPTNFTETSSSSFTLAEGLKAGTKVVVELFQ